jgi:PDDEXK-like domain of unknown function (DUF3799)
MPTEAERALQRLLHPPLTLSEPTLDAPATPPFRIREPGLYKIDAAHYHADPCPEPSLSASLARTLLVDSPWHAKHAHPRLTAQPTVEESESLDLGTVAHALLLEGIDRAIVFEFTDWRTQLARDARDLARAKGKIPLLRKHAGEIAAMLRARHAQLAEHVAGRFMFQGGGSPEVTLVWQEDNGIWCRALVDWLRVGHLDDYKTTRGSAGFQACEKRMVLENDAWALKAAFYVRGAEKVLGDVITLRYAVQELYAPYALNVVGLQPSAQFIGQRQAQAAIDLWGECLRANHWPGYPTETMEVGMGEWAEAKWMAKEERGY